MPQTSPPMTDPNQASPEMRVLLGMFALYWRMDEALCKQDIITGLGRVECNLLLQLDCPRRMGELAKRLLLVPSSVTMAADRLEQDGLAQRVRDAGDRRAFQLQLTEKGRVLRDALEKRAEHAFREICGLNEDDIQQFAVLSDKLQKKFLGFANRCPGKEK
ncbi:MarR family winged helix-turn-helix transcriptional regulator [Pseudophaeobacter sp. EL27]|uniref:MarR family winged helix-turn-helix transcriptional regulator n=1 Tax=Pseudophaeobacter sp. EL27 TaxID=2107580 RepID=UPI0020B17306|nr:MarR family transcriptional regulator [Pseudophaeobacter sp. EL27]